jgi:hypothetical protein
LVLKTVALVGCARTAGLVEEGTMMPAESASAFRGFLLARRVDIDAAALDEITGAALDFYSTVSASGLAATADADMLLFQVGLYDWGNGEHVEFDLTRQFIVDDEGEDAISQLRCTVLYEPTIGLRSIARAHRWCNSRDEVAAFARLVRSSDAYRTVLPLPIKRRQIAWIEV